VADEADVAAVTVVAVAAVATEVAARRSGPLERSEMRLRLRKTRKSACKPKQARVFLTKNAHPAHL
jgi:hypothetical protein